MRSAMLLVGLTLLCAPVHAELPCVSPSDAVLVIESPAAVAPGTDLYCGPGQRVGLWIASTTPVTVEHVAVMGCEVGIVVGVGLQNTILRKIAVYGSRVGVCIQSDDVAIRASYVHAAEGVIIEPGLLQYGPDSIWIEDNWFDGLNNPFGPVYRESSCTCAGAV